MSFERISAEDDELSRVIVGAAIEVHRVLGPGFVEKIYERALMHELGLRGLRVQPQLDIPVHYKDITIPGQQLDLLVNDRIILELKAIEQLLPLHEAQLLSYLKATGLRLGLLLNFNVRLMKDGIKRLIL